MRMQAASSDACMESAGVSTSSVSSGRLNRQALQNLINHAEQGAATSSAGYNLPAELLSGVVWAVTNPPEAAVLESSLPANEHHEPAADGR